MRARRSRFWAAGAKLAWGERAGDAWKQAVANADAVIHLAGEAVAGHKWTPEYKAKIRASRVDSTRLLVDAMRDAERKPGVFVSTSAIGYYGDRKDESVTEKSAPANDFLAEVCVAWEAEARRAEEYGDARGPDADRCGSWGRAARWKRCCIRSRFPSIPINWAWAGRLAMANSGRHGYIWTT